MPLTLVDNFSDISLLKPLVYFVTAATPRPLEYSHDGVLGHAGEPSVSIASSPGFGYTFLPQERAETPPEPTSIVPFRRDLDFVERSDLLDQIGDKVSQPAARVALVGLGGIGKSQLAIEYCYRLREQSPETWVVWIHASNAMRFEQARSRLALQGEELFFLRDAAGDQ